jgi:peptidoglycan/LPS O-acetylase OafA/YrhL
MPASLQALCMGGLLAYFFIKQKDFLNYKFKFIKNAGVLAIIIYIIFKLFIPRLVYFDLLLISIFTFWIFTIIVLNQGPKIFNIIMDNSVLNFFGKISYGIYIYHYFIPTIFKASLHFSKKHISVNSAFYEIITYVYNNNFLIFIICFIILIVLSYLSFKYIERPFLNYKYHFN